jgi:signal transduction histidine kinase/CheY-like chemotaxis protein/Ca2+/Na+ antiporter
MLNNLGLGSFAPTMATVYALGLDPAVAFPIMMGAATFSVPIASIQFIRHDSYSRRITAISAVCGTLGVLAAAFALQNTDTSLFKWLIALVLLYSAFAMFRTALHREDVEAVPAPSKTEKTETRLSIVGRLTTFCLALILVCTLSLIVIFVRNFHLISSNYVEVSISEHNARLRDNVHAYLREHESVLLSARAGAVHFVSREPVALEEFRKYLEDSAKVLDDISTLYFTTNTVWNSPGGFAVFSQPWDVPQDWNNTERLWFIAAKAAKGKVAYSKPYVDALTGDIILDMSASVFDDEEKDIGVVSVSITIEALSAMLGKTALEGGQIFLIDAEGVFVVHPDKATVGQGDFFTDAGLEAYRDEILKSSHFSATDRNMAVYSSSISAAGWFVVSMTPTEDISSSISERLISIFLTPMLIIFFMLLAVLICLLIIIRRESKDKVMAEQLTREKDSFMARISHEIRTPVNVMLGMSLLAAEEHGTAKTLEYVRSIIKAGTSLRGIINDILDFSRIEAGRLEFVEAPYETAAMLRDALALIRVQASQKSLDLRVDADDSLPRALVGDVERVKQVLLNLLSNAVKYSNEGLIRLSASGEFMTENSLRLTFTVEDSGIGIRAEEMPRLFDDFARLDEKRNSSIEGTGLGLAIARRLCRAMNGDITATSEYGTGSIFTATLTQKVADALTMEAMDRPPAPKSADKRRISFIAPEAEVLVADDLPDNLKVTEGLLRPYGMRISTCLNGREALKRVQAHSFELVLMDHMMPEMGGMEATQAIRALGGRHAELPIAALTAHAVSGMKEIFLANGFSDFLAKPIETAALDVVLRRWIPAAKQRDVPPEVAEALAAAPPPQPSFGMDGIAKEEIAAHRLNLLNHYRWHFVNGLPADQAYYEKFCALVDVLDVPEHLQGAAATLASAGRRYDEAEVTRLLPELYEALAAVREERKSNENAGSKSPEKALRDTLMRLKTALDQGDAKKADIELDALRAMDDMNDEARDMYFFLYDALLVGETEKASAKLNVWMRERFS